MTRVAEKPLDASRLRGQLTAWPAVYDFIFAGAAVFTLVSLKTGVRLTYKVAAKKEDVKAGVADVTYFVNLLRGPDNTTDWAYLGVLCKPGNFFVTSASKITRHPTSYKSLVWFLDMLQHRREGVLGKTLEFWHSGRCGCCGRLLTVPSSVASGIGPVCDGKR
jgi:hypothetical protein